MGSYFWKYLSPVFPIKWNVFPQFYFERNIATIDPNPGQGTDIVLFKFSSWRLMVWQSSRDLSQDFLLKLVPHLRHTPTPRTSAHHELQLH